MSKREQYGLLFNKVRNSDGEISPYVSERVPVTYNSVLIFIDGLDQFECESLISDLERCINGQGNVDEGFFSDGVEHMTILYQYPNINIDNVLIMPMQDMKELLQEWLAFIST